MLGLIYYQDNRHEDAFNKLSELHYRFPNFQEDLVTDMLTSIRESFDE